MKWKYFIPILLLLVPSTLGKFIITTAREPVVAVVGEDTVLDCQLIPAEAPEEMEVRWFRKDWANVVHLYRQGADQPESQNKYYSGRTELFHGLFGNGNVSLLLKKVTVKDDGLYTCFVVSKALDAEGTVSLKVGQVGLEPVVKMAGYQGNGIKLSCVSNDWYPEPSIKWQNGNGEELAGVLEKPKGDSRGLFKVESSLDVTEDSNNRYTCTIINRLLSKQEESNIQISGEFFPHVSGWTVAFWIMLCALLAGIGVVLYFYRKQRLQDRELSKLNMRPTISEYEALAAKLHKEQVRATQKEEKLLKAIENEKLAAELECKKLIQLIEWGKMLRCAVSVSLDPDTANGNLNVSQDRTMVKDGGEWQEVTENPNRFERYPFVFANEGFLAGKHYWEVEVGESSNWDLGVAKESVERKGRITLNDEYGYWAVGCYWNKYEVKTVKKVLLTLSEKPRKIGIFLNYDEGIVSFHDADTKEHLYTFHTKFTEKVYPFFCPWRSQEPLKITPVTLEN
ncbi:butyrophilin subfamily 1 member A1-like [Carcharodon carcharias]|uniref:butyrophilin subfamily 1 member A1-like n=1 Tax=Carcharodon carcharias TaxID=13397 RepID=UPI001B7D99D0|nr:butyrophilin subfamily 1 member A1-like [Carcharodon carcharias]